jgi:dihydrofolate reductase
MRSLIVTAFVSADGVMDSPGGGNHRSAGWSFKDVEFDPDVYTLKEQEQNETGALLLGRQTYQEFAPVWPSMEEFATYNAMPKYVVSRTLEHVDPNWPATILRSIDDVARLKEETDGGTIAVGLLLEAGSSTATTCSSSRCCSAPASACSARPTRSARSCASSSRRPTATA